jgi:hypothetical protein
MTKQEQKLQDMFLKETFGEGKKILEGKQAEADVVGQQLEKQFEGYMGLTRDSLKQAYIDKALGIKTEKKDRNKVLKLAIDYAKADDKDYKTPLPERVKKYIPVVEEQLYGRVAEEEKKSDLDLTKGIKAGAKGFTKIKVISPEGTEGFLPPERIEEALKRGFKRAQ